DPRTLDVVTKWIVATRAAVLPMTLFAGLVAGLLAVRADGFSWPLYGLALLGIVLAHTCNNIMNDLSDTDAGLDTDGYARALYAPHPIHTGRSCRAAETLARTGTCAPSNASAADRQQAGAPPRRPLQSCASKSQAGYEGAEQARQAAAIGEIARDAET
ncbi:MAG TPA: hypothetical protein VFX27_11685, partial [Sphingobium sp.]|nr:hypothetical protein [Sphingobium sp.]